MPGSDRAARRAPDGPAVRSPLAGGQGGRWAGGRVGGTRLRINNGAAAWPLQCSPPAQPGSSPAHSSGSFKPSLSGGFCFDSPLRQFPNVRRRAGSGCLVREGHPLAGSGKGSALAKRAVGRRKGKRTPPWARPGRPAMLSLRGFCLPCRIPPRQSAFFPTAGCITPCQLKRGGWESAGFGTFQPVGEEKLMPTGRSSPWLGNAGRFRPRQSGKAARHRWREEVSREV